MLASVKPVVSMAQMVSGRSTLRNYRRAKNAVPEPTKADTSNGNKTIQSVIGSRTLPSDISVTPVLTKSSTVSNDIKRQIEHQPPSVSCYPIGREVVEKTQEMSIDDLMAAKKLKDEQHPGSGPSQQNNRSFQLPKGLTITEISSKSEKPASEKPPVNYEVQALPVLHIPDVPTGISTASKGDRHFDLLKKFDEASSGTGGDKRPVPSSKPSNGIVGGHPGMPNGLLRMTASLQQKSDYSRPGIGRIQTKVTPKDLKSQQALDKIEMRQAQLPVYANTTADVYPAEPAAARALLAGQLAKPVEFVAEIEAMYAAGVTQFVEVGPGNRLTGLVQAILGERAHSAIALDASSGKRSGVADLARTLAQLAVAGHGVRAGLRLGRGG